MIDYDLIYRNIKGLLEKQGITTRELETVIQLSHGYLARCAHSTKKRLSIDAVSKIANFFNVSIEDLISKELVPKSYYIKVRMISNNGDKCTVETESGRLLEVERGDIHDHC